MSDPEVDAANKDITSTPPSTTVHESNASDFSKWKNGEIVRSLINNVIVNYNKTVQIKDVSDNIAWNIGNLEKNHEWKNPDQVADESLKIKSLIWICCFKSYVLAEMKKEWKKEYVRVFHTDKYNCLHKVGYFPNVISFKGLCQRLSDNKTSEVSIFVLCVCLFLKLIKS